MTAKSIKIVCVGDHNCGKTTLLIRHASGVFPTKYVPTVFDNSSAIVTVDGHEVSLGLWDTAGQEDYDRLRPLSYSQADAFIILFKVTSPTSFENITRRWLPEIQRFTPSSSPPRIVLATSTVDLRDEAESVRKVHEEFHRGCITTEEGRALAKQIHADLYWECSSKTGEGVDRLFLETIRLCIEPKRVKKHGLLGSMRRLVHRDDTSSSSKKGPEDQSNWNDNVEE